MRSCEKERSKNAAYYIYFTNAGAFPVDKVRISIRSSSFSKLQPLEPTIMQATPPITFKVERKDRYLVVNFEEPFPPHSYIRFTVAGYDELARDADLIDIAPSVWIASETSGTYVSWSMD